MQGSAQALRPLTMHVKRAQAQAQLLPMVQILAGTKPGRRWRGSGASGGVLQPAAAVLAEPVRRPLRRHPDHHHLGAPAMPLSYHLRTARLVESLRPSLRAWRSTCMEPLPCHGMRQAVLSNIDFVMGSRERLLSGQSAYQMATARRLDIACISERLPASLISRRPGVIALRRTCPGTATSKLGSIEHRRFACWTAGT